MAINTSKTTWDLSPLLNGDNDPKITSYREQITEATDTFVKKWRANTSYLKDPTVMKEALDDLEQWERTPGLGNEGFYFGMRLVTDSSNPDLQAKDNQATEFFQGIITKMQFFWLSISNIASEDQTHFLEAPELTDYKHWLEKEFASGIHTLSEAEEKIMLLKRGVSHERWRDMTERFLAQGERTVKDEGGKEVAATMETLLSLINSRDKATRDNAAVAFNDFLIDYTNTAEAEMNALLANKKIDDELRGYTRPEQSRHIADDIETEVVDTLIEAVSGRFDISQRYYALKAKLMGQKQLKYHERNVPYGKAEKSYTYPEAVALVDEVYREVDPELADIYKRFTENGQVDVFPKKGKRAGAFCTINGLNHPVYVMLNHTDKLQDVSTIAHEFGHAVNHELMKRENALNYGMGLATAEVASTFMEGFVLKRLLRDADDELRLNLMLDQLNGYVSSIMRQAAMYQFEQELHAHFRKVGFASKEVIGSLFQKHMTHYMGKAVEQSPGSENWWLYVGHFRSFFYVYSYVSGDLISKALQAKVFEDPTYIKTIKDKFLSVGSSKSVKVLFADMNIDITDKAFWDTGLNQIDQLLADTEALAQKLGKL